MKLARLVRARDGRCRFPGCGVPARNCDLDHILAFNHDNPSAGGATTAENLHCLCRWHHRLKTRGDWTVRLQTGAIMVWTSPTGTVHETLPHGGDGISHREPDTDIPQPPPPPEDFTDPPSWSSDDLPDPYNDDDLQRLINGDPMSLTERRALDDQRRLEHPPPDPEEPHILHVVRCDCLAPF
ncbi:MAG: HNH endonuclease [Actinomycetota bacterium]|nr:HNH endonuclease [Actinomycetota bacterium]